MMEHSKCAIIRIRCNSVIWTKSKSWFSFFCAHRKYFKTIASSSITMRTNGVSACLSMLVNLMRFAVYFQFYTAHYCPIIIRIIHPRKSYEFHELMCVMHRCRISYLFSSCTVTKSHRKMKKKMKGQRMRFNEWVLKYH